MPTHSIELISATLKKFLGADYKDSSLTPLLPLVPMSGGNSSAKVFLVNTEKKTYVLRMIDPTFSQGKVERTQKIMEYAARAELAPRLYEVDPEGRGVIMEFIHGKKLSDYSGRSDPKFLKQLAQTIRKLHRGPRVAQAPSTFDSIQERVNQIQSVGAILPTGFSEWVRILGFIEKAIAKHFVQRVSCHGDLNPANILIQDVAFNDSVGQKIFLIDWDRSGLGDPFRDLSTIAVFLNFSEAQSKQFLADYWGRSFDAQDFAHLYLLRHCHLMLGAFWAFQHPYAIGITDGSPLLSSTEMDLKLGDSRFPSFHELDQSQSACTAVDFQELALSCVKQFLIYTSSFEFKLHLNVLNETKRRSIFYEKDLEKK